MSNIGIIGNTNFEILKGLGVYENVKKKNTDKQVDKHSNESPQNKNTSSSHEENSSVPEEKE